MEPQQARGVSAATDQPPLRHGNRHLARAGAAEPALPVVYPKRICSGCSSAAGARLTAPASSRAAVVPVQAEARGG